MSKELYLVVEGQTEQFFAERVLAPYFAVRNIFVRAMMIPKKGSKGGDVKFERVKSCVSNLLKQRRDTIVATFVDYYGTPATYQRSSLLRPSREDLSWGRLRA